MFKLQHKCPHLLHYQSNAQDFQARLQHDVNQELPDDQAGFRKISRVHRTGKDQFSFQSQRKEMKGMLKLPHNCTHLTL